MGLDISKFGKNLKIIRKRLGYTQESLAEAAHVSTSYIIKIENAQDTPGIETAIKLSTALDVPLEYFLKDEGYRLYTTYSNLFLIQEMNKLDEEKFSLLSDTLGTLSQLFDYKKPKLEE